jgi:formate hydrogenlyase subunit 4
MHIIIILIQIILTALLSPLGIGLIKKIKAKLQNRQGASIVQPYKDLWKLLHKDETISADASWIFTFAPYIVFTVTLLAAAGIPLFVSIPFNKVSGDMLLVVYTFGIGTFFLALAGMDVGSAFGGFGSSREMTTSALAEGGLIFSLLTIAMVSGSANLSEMSHAITTSYSRSILPILLAFSGFFIVLLCETKRYPFDNPATHLELTMIHEAMLLEYSGKRLALMEWAAANKLFLFAALGTNLFFPWGISHTAQIGSLMFGLTVFIIKMLVFYAAIAIIESSMAKFRFFRLPDLLVISFILNVIAIGLVRFPE